MTHVMDHKTPQNTPNTIFDTPINQPATKRYDRDFIEANIASVDSHGFFLKEYYTSDAKKLQCKPNTNQF